MSQSENDGYVLTYRSTSPRATSASFTPAEYVSRTAFGLSARTGPLVSPRLEWLCVSPPSASAALALTEPPTGCAASPPRPPHPPPPPPPPTPPPCAPAPRLRAGGQ